MPTQFIADVSSNHHADRERCLTFVETAARMGCDAVKFQLFRLERLFAPEVLACSCPIRERRELELPVSFLPEIARACRAQGISFICTPFDLQAVDELAPYVDCYKIASYELTWPDLLRACGMSGKPVILSTGMATLAECLEAVATIREAGCEELSLLHCVSAYPTRPEEANLAAMDTLRRACACPVGWSDHSVSPAVVYQAIFGHRANLLEFHLDLDGLGAEFASGHCWLQTQMAEVIRTVRIGELAEGDGQKRVTSREEKERLWRADPEDGLRPFKAVRDGFWGR